MIFCFFAHDVSEHFEQIFIACPEICRVCLLMFLRLVRKKFSLLPHCLDIYIYRLDVICGIAGVAPFSSYVTFVV